MTRLKVVVASINMTSEDSRTRGRRLSKDSHTFMDSMDLEEDFPCSPLPLLLDPASLADDPLSPSSSDSGSTSTLDSQGSEGQLSKPSLPALPPCRVCGKPASGLHYGVNTCEACKVFFKRTLQRNAVYSCKRNGKCQIVPSRRRYCAHCRYEKCRAVGMSRSSIKTGRYSHEKKVKDILEIKKHYAESQVEPRANTDALFDQAKSVHQQDLAHLVKYLAECAMIIDPESLHLSSKLGDEQIQFMEVFKLRQEIFGSLDPVDDDEYSTFYCMTGLDLDGRREILNQWLVMINACIKRLIQFAMFIPGYSDLCTQDQAALIKYARHEALFIGGHRRFNAKLQCYTMAMSGKVLHKTDLVKALGHEDYVDTFFKLAQELTNLRLSYAEYVLLTAIALFFSDRCDLKEPSKIEAIQLKLVEALQYSLRINHPSRPGLFPNIVNALVNIRALSEISWKILERIYLDMPDIDLPDLILSLCNTDLSELEET
ncbi:retinoic acid receptor beta [Lingula anatina]|uniref:Retinoic acid receptor beta n=1 Tax=Lingula anatina TaxID=7574 RepID=A0A1S3JQH1_LINAN|nr:retinoic acid receptor beta [Lingula anatina]|eukprot:XP_013412600.1 retinoic acid receptor beta [Lingula anatina]